MCEELNARGEHWCPWVPGDTPGVLWVTETPLVEGS